MIPDIIVLGRSFVLSQSCFQVSASLPNVSSQEVNTFDSVHGFLSDVRSVFVHVAYWSIYVVSSDRLVSYTDVVRL